mmetsp:Transcript_8492/g.18890  ORF Transcript_8492/g.18890 Transcript_8492/m.18890 type:complete len:214 (-) Transcript_8492:1605-2246(-)
MKLFGLPEAFFPWSSLFFVGRDREQGFGVSAILCTENFLVGFGGDVFENVASQVSSLRTRAESALELATSQFNPVANKLPGICLELWLPLVQHDNLVVVLPAVAVVGVEMLLEALRVTPTSGSDLLLTEVAPPNGLSLWSLFVEGSQSFSQEVNGRSLVDGEVVTAVLAGELGEDLSARWKIDEIATSFRHMKTRLRKFSLLNDAIQHRNHLS